jgi:hypothetical protein
MSEYLSQDVDEAQDVDIAVLKCAAMTMITAEAL